MRNLSFLSPLALLVVAFGCTPAPGPDRTPAVTDFSVPGPTHDGAVLLPNQWYLRPAGKQLALGDFPVNIAMHPGGKFAAILHSGFG